MKDKINDLIKEFSSEIKKKYPNLYIEVNYDSEEDLYEVWHDNADLEYKNIQFKELVGLKAQEILFDNDIFNFYFGYDYFKTLEKASKVYSFINKDLKIKIEGKVDKKNIQFNDNKAFEMGKNKKTKSDKIEINLDMSNLDKKENIRKYTINKNSSKKINLENGNRKQNIREMGLAS